MKRPKYIWWCRYEKLNTDTRRMCKTKFCKAANKKCNAKKYKLVESKE